MLLDFEGGTLSLAQQLLDGYATHDLSAITGNPVKFALGFVSMAFDCVFFTQHYVLYRGARTPSAAATLSDIEDGVDVKDARTVSLGEQQRLLAEPLRP